MDGKRSIQIDRISKLTSIEDVKAKIAQEFDVVAEQQRLFFSGKQLEDGHSLFDYNVGLNAIIQVMFRTVEACPLKKKTENELKTNKEQSTDTYSTGVEDADLTSPTQEDNNNGGENNNGDSINKDVSHFKINDKIDAMDTTMGAWFEAIVVKITKEGEKQETYYHVRFEDYEENEVLKLRETEVRPRARIVLSWDEVNIGDKVMANYNPDEPKERGFWYDVVVTRKVARRNANMLYGKLLLGKDDSASEECGIIFIDEIFKIEKSGKVKPDCSHCKDDPKKPCKECSCHFVEIIVNNQMLHNSATIHWHGFHMYQTPWMDGVGYITQCPIAPMTSFMYRFIASPSGTLWYHAHLGGLRADGAFGLFIVHKKTPTMPFFPFVVNHWLHIPFNEYMITNPYKKLNQGAIAGSAEHTYSFEHLHMEKPMAWRTTDGVRLSSMMFTSALVNGRGRYNNNKAPIAWFKVTAASWNGFYILNPGVEYTFAISVDQHEMEILDLGVGEVEPVPVNIIYLNPGERARVRVLANQRVGNYWIRSRTLDDQGEVLAVLHYEGANDQEPASIPKICTELSPCRIFNCPAFAFPDKSKICKASFSFKGIGRSIELANKIQNADLEVFMDFAFPIGASINGFRFVLPKNHLYSDIPLDHKCSRRECSHKGCFCTHYIDLPFNKTVQLVLANYGDSTKEHGHHHTIHLHGYDFAVLKTGFPEFDPLTGEMIARNKDLYCVDKLCRKMRWVNYEDVVKTFKLKGPPLQDTVLLPYGGYTVVRIRTDNPGNWLMHCHQMMHAIEGMDVVIRVAPSKAMAPPSNFPKYCGGFTIDHKQFQRYIKTHG